MQDVTSISTRSDRTLLALSLACFGAAGIANTAVGADGRTLLAMTVAVVGVYGFARYARSVGRPHLARLSLALWVAFLAVALVHVLDITTVTSATAALLPSGVVAAGVAVLTWTTLLGAASATAFLAFREYGANTGVETPDEQFLDL